MRAPGPVARGAGLAAALLAIIAGILLARAELAWRRADALRAGGDAPAAVREARRVFDLYVPGNPRLEDASALIWDEALGQERRGDWKGALVTYRLLRSGWIAAHPVSGEGSWVPRCERAIARLSARGGAGARDESAKGGRDPEAAALAALRAPRRPHGAWGGMAALGFAAWIGATLGLIARGLGSVGDPRRARLGFAALLLAGYVLWIAGLIRA